MAPSTTSARPGRIFTEYTWGDYSVARHRATFVDGRTDLFEGPVLTEFMAVTNLTTNPDPVLSAYHVSYVVWAPPPRSRSTSARDSPGTSSTAPRWPWSSPAAERRSDGRRSADVASRPRRSPSSSDQVRRRKPAPPERRGEQVGLVAAELEQHRPAPAQEAGGLGDDPSQQRQAVRTAVVVGGILERQRVAGEQVELVDGT